MDSLMFLAAGASPPGPSLFGSGAGLSFIIQIAMLAAVFYFFILRPQQKRVKEHEAKIAAVQKNDEVVTGGGLMGKVTKVADDHVEVEIAPNVRVRAIKTTLTNVTPRGTKAAND